MLRYIGGTDRASTVITGIACDLCILFTAGDAFLRDYLVFVPSDCTASIDPEQNRRALEQIRTSGDSLRGITQIVDQSSQAARQIVASVNQQNAGIAQISTAILSLNASMQDTLKGVRQAEQSAVHVRGTSTRLSDLVSSFKM